MQTALGACGAVAGLVMGEVGARGEARMKARKMLRWQAHPVGKMPGGYQVAVADVNGDGRPDVLALSTEQSLIEWYENPTWKSHPITTRTRQNVNLAPLFVPMCPARGLVVASDFALEDSTQGGSLWWAAAPLFALAAGGEEAAGSGTSPSSEEEWKLTLIDKLPTAHRLRWADLDGDERLELVAAPLLGYGAEPPDYRVAAPLTWFEPPEVLLRGHASAASLKDGAWVGHLIDESLTVVHGIAVIDWDGDGRDELLTASFEGVHLFHSTGRGSDLRWTKTQLATGDQVSRPRRGASEVAVGRIGNRRFLVTIEPWHGEQVVVYREGKPGELWSRQVIDDTFREGHALACADLDGDGKDEIVAGFRGPGTSLYIYYAADSAGVKWERQTLDTEMAASCAVVADMNGDGRPDVVAIGASTGNVKWYENQG